jgi:hypothetical protein
VECRVVGWVCGLPVVHVVRDPDRKIDVIGSGDVCTCGIRSGHVGDFGTGLPMLVSRGMNCRNVFGEFELHMRSAVTLLL